MNPSEWRCHGFNLTVTGFLGLGLLNYECNWNETKEMEEIFSDERIDERTVMKITEMKWTLRYIRSPERSRCLASSLPQ
jgi:hypothetical protein